MVQTLFQIAAFCSYIVYLIIAIYGVTTIKVGMNYAQLLPDGSKTSAYLSDFGDYMSTSISPSMEVLLPTCDMSILANQQRAINIIREFENQYFTLDAKFWLLDFLPFFERTGGEFYAVTNNKQ
jgi:hypothetical protein